MTTDLQKDLAEVVPLASTAQHNDAFTLGRLTGFILTHHTTIQQNAEAALRLRALEQAFYHMKTSTAERFLECLGIEGDPYKPLDELLREWKENNNG